MAESYAEQYRFVRVVRVLFFSNTPEAVPGKEKVYGSIP
jgi:hypothetical protein